MHHGSGEVATHRSEKLSDIGSDVEHDGPGCPESLAEVVPEIHTYGRRAP
jgi:hypothetical protein